MFRTLKRVLLIVFLGQVLALIAGRAVQRRLLSEDVGLNAVNSAVIVGGKEDSFVARGFTGGKVRVVMGGLDLDLQGCQISEPPAVINVNVWFGGVQIRVPAEWNVRIDASNLLGGFEDTRPALEMPDDTRQYLRF